MIHKVIFTKDGKKFSIRDATKDYHCQYGFYSAADLSKNGQKIVSNKGKEAFVIDSCFIDSYEKITRGAQIIPLKDIGTIITKAGIGRDSRIVDAGAGSGALCILLSRVAKEVTTYEIREDFFRLVKKSIDDLGIKNLTIKNQDVTAGIDEKNIDVVTLDLPAPWEALAAAKSCLKPGGFLVSYSPTIPQVMDLVCALQKDEGFLYFETIEILERQWEINERKVRPKSQQIGHSGFLSFARKVMD